jgi:hypothetical protein
MISKHAVDQIYNYVKQMFWVNEMKGCCFMSSLIFHEVLQHLKVNSNIKYGYKLDIVTPLHHGKQAVLEHLWVEVNGEVYDIGDAIAQMEWKQYFPEVPYIAYPLLKCRPSNSIIIRGERKTDESDRLDRELTYSEETPLKDQLASYIRNPKQFWDLINKTDLEMRNVIIDKCVVGTLGE